MTYAGLLLVAFTIFIGTCTLHDAILTHASITADAVRGQGACK